MWHDREWWLEWFDNLYARAPYGGLHYPYIHGFSVRDDNDMDVPSARRWEQHYYLGVYLRGR